MWRRRSRRGSHRSRCVDHRRDAHALVVFHEVEAERTLGDVVAQVGTSPDVPMPLEGDQPLLSVAAIVDPGHDSIAARSRRCRSTARQRDDVAPAQAQTDGWPVVRCLVDELLIDDRPEAAAPADTVRDAAPTEAASLRQRDGQGRPQPAQASFDSLAGASDAAKPTSRYRWDTAGISSSDRALR